MPVWGAGPGALTGLSPLIEAGLEMRRSLT